MISQLDQKYQYFASSASLTKHHNKCRTVQVCQQIGVQIGFHIHDNKQLMSSQCRECQPLEKLENICSGNKDARKK